MTTERPYLRRQSRKPPIGAFPLSIMSKRQPSSMAAVTRSRADASMTYSEKHKWRSSQLLKLRPALRARLTATSAKEVAIRPS
jgi:hypothetical protein